MPPEYETYRASPHQSLDCVACHVGEDTFSAQLFHKLYETSKVFATLSHQYDTPISATSFPPAETTCLDCHQPTRFEPLMYKEFPHYATDPQNTRTVNRLILKTGSGQEDRSVGPYIHWHATGEVWHLALDAREQIIPYVRVVLPDGSTREYYDITTDYTPEKLGGTFLQRMDCTTCHNRVAHRLDTPDTAVDQAMAQGRLDAEIPFLKREAVRLLSAQHTTLDEGLEAIASLPQIYQENYPDAWREHAQAIRDAVPVLQGIFRQTHYPEQDLTPFSHPDNIGHREWAGCFRCHDGKHLTLTGDRVIPYACTTCHTVPVQNGNQLLVDGCPTPATHENPFWLSLHGKALDASCAECHPPLDPETDYTRLTTPPPPDGSFCGNTLCHQTTWTYAGWNTPEMQPFLERALDTLLHTSPYLKPGQPLTYESTFKTCSSGAAPVATTRRKPKAAWMSPPTMPCSRAAKRGPALFQEIPKPA